MRFYEHAASRLVDYDCPGFNASGAHFRRQLTLREWSKLSTNWKVFGLIATLAVSQCPWAKISNAAFRRGTSVADAGCKYRKGRCEHVAST